MSQLVIIEGARVRVSRTRQARTDRWPVEQGHFRRPFKPRSK